MSVGSTYAAAKAAIVSKLDARSGLDAVTVLGEPPVDALRLLGPTGSGQAIWIADAEGEYDNVVFCGAGRLDLDETYGLVIVFQALPLATESGSETQASTDAKVDALLFEFLDEMAGDPTWGVTAFQQFYTSRGSFRRYVGPVTDRNIRPSRCEFTLEVNARISFT